MTSKIRRMNKVVETLELSTMTNFDELDVY